MLDPLLSEPHICPLTWASQLDLGEERSSGVARSAIDSQQSHNWPVKRKGLGSAWLCRGANASSVVRKKKKQMWSLFFR